MQFFVWIFHQESDWSVHKSTSYDSPVCNKQGRELCHEVRIPRLIRILFPIRTSWSTSDHYLTSIINIGATFKLKSWKGVQKFTHKIYLIFRSDTPKEFAMFLCMKLSTKIYFQKQDLSFVTLIHLTSGSSIQNSPNIIGHHLQFYWRFVLLWNSHIKKKP